MMSEDFETRLKLAIHKRAKFIGPRLEDFRDAFERLTEIGTHHLGYRRRDRVPPKKNKQLIREVREWISQVTDGPMGTAAFTDATTLFNVSRLLEDRYLPHPELLYDLATFVEGAILFDRIFHLGNPRIADDAVYRINEAIGDPLIITVPIDWDKHDPYWLDSSPLRCWLTGLWNEVAGYFNELEKTTPGDLSFDAANNIRASWQALLQVPLPDNGSLFRFLDQYFDTPVDTLAEQAVGLLRAEASSFGYQSRGKSVRAAYLLANESNQRSRFNLRVADELALPYLQSWARLPYRSFYEAQAFRAQNFLATADFLEHEYRSRAEAFMKSRVTLQLPFLLTAVLSRISRLDEFFEELGRIRLKTANLRKRRAELDRQINEGNKLEIEKLRAAVADEARRVMTSDEKIAIAGITGIVVAFGAAQLGLGGIEALALPAFLLYAFTHGVAHKVADEKITKASERLLKPEFSMVTDLAKSAEALTNGLPKVQTLWGVKDARLPEFAVRFGRLAHLRPGV
jgi:hypothetical protein